MITEQNLINYLQSQFDDFNEDKARYGVGNHIVSKKFDAMIACKEMTETLISKPVNLGLDGKVTVTNNLPVAEKFNGKYVTEMTMDEVFSLYNMLRSKGNLSATEAGWFQICKERIIDHGVKTHAFDYDPFKCSNPSVDAQTANGHDFVLEIYSRKTDNFIEQVVVDPVLNNILVYAKKNPLEDDMKYVVKRIDYKLDDDGNVEEEIGTTTLYDDLVKDLV